MFKNFKIKRLIRKTNLFKKTEKELLLKIFPKLSDEKKDEIYNIILDYIDSNKSISLQYIEKFKQDLEDIKTKAREKKDLAPEAVADDMQKALDLIKQEIKKK